MGQQANAATMNPSAPPARSSGYHQKAMEEIHNSLLPFAKSHGGSGGGGNGGGGNGGEGSSAASTISNLSATSGVSSLSSSCSNGLTMGYLDVRIQEPQLRHSNHRADAALEYLFKQQQHQQLQQQQQLDPKPNNTTSTTNYPKLIRKPSIERELSNTNTNNSTSTSTHRGSPALDSGAGSSRSDSPRLLHNTGTEMSSNGGNMTGSTCHTPVSRQYSPVFSGGGGGGGGSVSGEPPPPPPPRNTPPPPPPQCGGGGTGGSYQGSLQMQMLKRMPPAPVVPARASPAVPASYSSSVSSQRGTSPVSSGVSTTSSSSSRQQPMVVQNGPQVQQQLSQQMQALSLYQGSTSANAEPPPPYPLMPPSPSSSGMGGGSSVGGGSGGGGSGAPPPPSYSASIQNRQSPTQDFRKSPSSGIYSGSASAGSPSPIPTISTIPTPLNPTNVATTTPTPPNSGQSQGSSSSSTNNSGGMARPTPLQAWGARQAKTQPPIIMQSVKSTQVQKPVLQTATAPPVPPVVVTVSSNNSSGNGSPTATTPPLLLGGGSNGAPPPPPSYNVSIQQKHCKPAAPLPGQQQQQQQQGQQQQQQQQQGQQSGQVTPTTEPPSYASTMQAKAKAVHRANVESVLSPRSSPLAHPPLQRKYSPGIDRSDSPQSTSSSCESRPPAYPDNGAPPLPPTASSSVKNNNNNHHHHIMLNGNSSSNNHHLQQQQQQHSHHHPPPHHPHHHPPPHHRLPPLPNSSPNNNNNNNNNSTTSSSTSTNTNTTTTGDIPPQLPPHNKIRHQSPIPERKKISKEKEDERRDGKVKNYSPQAFKFFMEQHIENVIKSYKQRVFRRMQLENEMNKIGLSNEAQCQMRKMLSQKESNYIRLKRAKMDKSMFVKIKPIGLGAFGEVSLVRKIDTNHLYAMKTLRKSDVLKRNQVAHVKAERDILAEADNEWVVKLYYSFQDSDNLYFVMDYIPGGDLMSLLIKLGIFKENLARFYIAELTCAVESVHKMGFIHRDIKPDNILIDKDGHIKLTDFGLCTGFRWTHNSKYYQPNDHARQDSMEPVEDWNEECKCKLLERRRRIEHQRCLAHSLVGTPNYIAPEVLQRTGYTQLCDWWSVGVILYEMLVGSPPFLANTPAETQHKVINWQTTLHIPKESKLSKEGTDLILKLCCGCEKRLGKNATEVKTHPFFRDIDYDKGLRRQRAPHIPIIEYATDTSNFDPIDPDKLRNSASLDSINSDDILDASTPFHGFFEFTFRRFFDDGGGPAFNRINLDDNDSQGPVYV